MVDIVDGGWPWLLVALGTAVSSAVLNHANEKHHGIRNSAVLSVILFLSFLVVDHLLLPGDWWVLGTRDAAIVLGLAVVLGGLNIVLGVWARRAGDYAEMAAKGLVSESCFHKDGRFQIPKNIVSNGSMALGEEVLFRGLVGVLLYLWLGPVVAIAVTALLFGLLHFGLTRKSALHAGVRPGRFVASTMVITTLSPAGFMAAVIFFGSVIPAWLLHWMVNCIMGAYMRYGRAASQSQVVNVARD